MAKVAHLVDAKTIALYRLTGQGLDGEVDRSGHGNDLAVSMFGEALPRVSGKFGAARRFNADATRYLSGSLSTPDLFALRDSLTVECLIRAPVVPVTGDGIRLLALNGYKDDVTITLLEIGFDPYTRELRVGYSKDSTFGLVDLVSTGYALPIDEWVHVAARSYGTGTDDQTLTLSVNGTEIARIVGQDSPDAPEDLNDLRLFVSGYYGEEFFWKGDVEEVAIRSDVRTDAQIVADAAGHEVVSESAPPEYTAPENLGVARDFLLDLSTCEIVLGPDGDWVLARDLDAIKQDAHTALGFIRGEWYLDDAFGFGLRDTVLVKSPNVDLIRAEVRRVLLTVVGIVSVTSVEVMLDKAARLAVVQWSAATDVGELLNQTTRIQA